MATALFSRRYVTLLSHWLGWGLLSYLLFFSHSFSNDIKMPTEFWLRQVVFQAMMIGTFYLNANVLVPRLLLEQKTGQYGLMLLGIISVTMLVLWGLETGLGLPLRFHKIFHPDGKGEPKYYGWVQPSLFTIVLVLGISTSLSLVQKWQADTTSRLALEQAKTSSELSFLKAQINPHFFFNTLNNIYALTSFDVELAQEAIHRLSRMMRYVLYETQSGTTLLSKEIAFVSDYVQLMQLRLTDKVQLTVQVPTPLHDQPIAPMILLPFVENAFKHGVSALEPSQICISIEQQPNQLVLNVRNTVFVNQKPSLEAGNGIGLTNTRRRLDLLYPNQYQLAIDPHTPAGDYEVQLTLNLS